ncbi:MAG: Cupredoxin-like domain [Pseudomonadota bacterium]|jgi:plastocyanin
MKLRNLALNFAMTVASLVVGASTSLSATTVDFTAKLEGGKKIWAPAEVKVEPGKEVTLKVTNTLTEPHGFEIAGHVQPQVIGAGETKTYKITPKTDGSLKVSCHLHPAHVPATIKVEKKK